MLQATLRTITEILDSKKAAYSFVAVFVAAFLHIYYKIPVEQALLLISPLGLATAAQAHVDAAEAKRPVDAVEVTTEKPVATGEKPAEKLPG